MILKSIISNKLSFIIFKTDSVAQLVEQYTFNVWVLGSNPSRVTKITSSEVIFFFILIFVIWCSKVFWLGRLLLFSKGRLIQMKIINQSYITYIHDDEGPILLIFVKEIVFF